MQSPWNAPSPFPTDSFLAYMHRRLSDIVASESRPILQEPPPNVNNESSSPLLSGLSRISHGSIDVMIQYNPPHFTESPSLRRAG